MNIKYLSHTADIRMKIQGSDLIELFQAGIIGMGNILKDGFCDKRAPANIKLKIELTAADSTCLLIDFLSEILSSSYVEKTIFCEVDFLRLTPSKMKAEIHGVRVEKFDEEIKAVTYHEAHVHCNEKGYWETVVIFDI